jgi:hypothetical protein
MQAIAIPAHAAVLAALFAGEFIARKARAHCSNGMDMSHSDRKDPTRAQVVLLIVASV